MSLADAHGGMTEVYQAAQRRFAYSEALQCEWDPSLREHLEWLREMIQHLERLHAVQLHVDKNMCGAIQTRRALAVYLQELGALLEMNASDINGGGKD